MRYGHNQFWNHQSDPYVVTSGVSLKDPGEEAKTGPHIPYIFLM